MKTTTIFICLVSAVQFSLVNCQSFKPRPIFQQFVPLFRGVRKVMFQVMGRNSEDMWNLQMAQRNRLLQEAEIPPNIQFPCNVTGFRSRVKPTSVHKLRPGDIDVIAALGDSMTAGYGLVAANYLQVFIENRGLSWSIGGQGSWKQYLTLPNILKEFNPKLFGYSLRDSYANQKDSQFNPSEGAAISSELPYMTEILIQRIKTDTRVDLKRDWKLITVMIGPNNFCLDICFKNNYTEELINHREDMFKVLRLLRDNLPRTIVNLVAPPDTNVLGQTRNPSEFCRFIRRIECYCMFSDQHRNKQTAINQFIKDWQKLDEEIANAPEFHRRDFEVVYQPFFLEVTIPLLTPEQTDFSYMSQDCFHLSQKMNARVANALWNNMLEPVGSKTNRLPTLFNPFYCPTDANPYIFTSKNSRSRLNY